MRSSETSGHPDGRGVLIIVENLPVPFDRRVWQEATALREAGYGVSVICPRGKGHEAAYECLGGVHIYRHSLPVEGHGAPGYLAEYSIALFWELWLSFKVRRRHGFDVVHACNPPDLIFLVAAVHKLLYGAKFLFDQHDLNPELYEVKFGRKGMFHTLLCFFERMTFRLCDASLATNETFKEIAVRRGGMAPERVRVVKSYPDLARFRVVDGDPKYREGFAWLAGYVGIMAEQDGVDRLVEAMAHMVNDLGRSDIGCLIVGEGPVHASLKELAARLGVEDHVRFTGYLGGDELLRALNALDIGVIPDPPNACNHKLSMNKVFEYMSLGLPFVQFDLEQAGKEAGEAALVVKDVSPEALARGMIALIEDGEARQRMSAYGRARAMREFQWANEKSALLEAYECLFS